MAQPPEGSQQPLSLRQRQKLFADQYFPGGGALPQPAITLHDAAHTYTGFSTGSGYPAYTGSGESYGEAMQRYADSAGTRELFRGTGAVGFPNSPYQFASDSDNRSDRSLNAQKPFLIRSQTIDRAEDFGVKYWNERVLRSFSGSSDDDMLAGRGNLRAPDISPEAPLEEINSPNRRFIPPITPKDLEYSRRMGREFYSQVADQFRRDPQRPAVGDYREASRRIPFDGGLGDVGITVNKAADYIHHNPDRFFVSGGAKPGALPAGHIMQHVSPPLHPGVDERLYRQAAFRAMKRDAVGLRNVSADDMLSKYTTDLNASTLASIRAEDVVDKALDPSMRTFPGVYELMRDQGRRNLLSQEGRNWAQLAQPGREVSTLKMPVTPEAAEAIVTARETQRVANAARGGAKAAVGISRAVPWLDPAFRNALDRDDIPAAAKVVASDYAAGALASPVVAAGAGVLQRAAPRMAGRVLPLLSGAAAAAQRSNPILATTLLSGDTPTRGPAADPRRAKHEQRVSQDQAIRAEAARRRGGRWKIGPFTIPELGISESGGLFFGAPSTTGRRSAPARPGSSPGAMPKKARR